MGKMEEVYVPGEFFSLKKKRFPKESNIYSHFSGFNFTLTLIKSVRNKRLKKIF